MIHKNNLEDIRYRKRRVCEDNRRKGNVNKKWKQMKSNENKEEEKNKQSQISACSKDGTDPL